MIKRILHLTLKKKWFDLIAEGKKCVEYREIKPYWRKRLQIAHVKSYTKVITYRTKSYNEVHFRNGYHKDSPFMRVLWEHMTYATYEGKKCFAIELGPVLEIRNWGR